MKPGLIWKIRLYCYFHNIQKNLPQMKKYIKRYLSHKTFNHFMKNACVLLGLK